MLLRIVSLLLLSGLTHAEMPSLESAFAAARGMRGSDFLLNGMLANQALRLAQSAPSEEDLKPLTDKRLTRLRTRTKRKGELQNDARFEQGTKLLKIPLKGDITMLFLSAPNEKTTIQMGYAIWYPKTREELQVIYKTGLDLKLILRTVVLFRDGKPIKAMKTTTPDDDDRKTMPEIAGELADYADRIDENGDAKPAPPPSKKSVQPKA